MSHALLSPSSASRWTVCTQSARMEEGFPETTSLFAEEGTICHRVAELMLRQFVGTVNEQTFNTILNTIQEDYDKLFPDTPDNFYGEIYEYASEYADFVKAQCFGDFFLLIEVKLDMTSWVPEGFGTADALVLKDNKIIFNDLKYGKGVRVNADRNKQLMLYALGALSDYGYMYDVEEIEMNIYQPRLDNISTFTISVTELLEWAETELKVKAELAFNGEGDFVAGDHCHFCRAAKRCKALEEYCIETAKADFSDPALLSDQDIVTILEKKKLIEGWLKTVSTYALSEAMHGREWPGLKLVAGRSKRIYSDKKAIEQNLYDNDFTGYYTVPTLLGITALEKHIGKNKFKQFVAPWVSKPTGRPTLVNKNDSRPAINAAEEDFSGVNLEEED